MKTENILSYIQEHISKGDEITPFLFIWKHFDSIHIYVQELVTQLTQQFEVDKNYIFTLTNSEESLKIEEIKDFVRLSFSKSPFAFQVFIIQNISRLTLQSANALLKFLEEPWVGNIVFLSNEGEAGVLDTILSRVKVVKIEGEAEERVSQETLEMIRAFVEKKDPQLLSFFYSATPTRKDAIDFLRAVFAYITRSLKHPEILSELDEDITGLEKNNLLPKWVIDKYIVLLSNYDSSK